ncbi:hypothetical protein LCGC14_1622880 [marine sediment metagenome]|uniref:Major tail protein n=1 Tax=marine sediment metagenome TaxID=412755 RepID=A0A0F9L4P1_9ZZZZ
MGAPSIFQIMKSNAVLWYGPVGETVPDETAVAPGAAWGGNWARLGATKEPLTFLYEDERADVNVEEYLSSVHRFKTSEALTIETVLAEIDADYMALMIGGSVSTTAAAGGQKGFDSLPVGNDALLTSYAFGFEGIHVDINAVELTLRVFVYRATAKVGGELTFSKREDDYTGVPITIEGLSDSATPGRLCVIEKVTAPVT